jgi:DUF4097 and DUF4098 domain-containing protein YvlB
MARIGVVELKRALQIVGLAGSLVLLVSLALTSLSQAQETHISRESGGWGEQINGSLSAVKILRVKVDMGSVVVRGGQQQGINYVAHIRFGNSSEQDARHQFDQYKITAYVKGDTAWIVGDWQGGRHQPRHCSSEFSVMVPREMTLVKLETNGGNVDAVALSGHVEAESGGGSIHFDDIGGGVNAETGGGSIDVGTVSGELGLHTGGGSIEVHQANGKVVAETGGGSVEIQGAQGAIVETGGGSIRVQHCNGKLKASTGGGGIDLGDIGGPVEIDTGGGTIRLTSAKGHVHAETGGGGIELFGVPSAQAQTGAGGITVKLVNTGGERRDSDLETGAGDITVYLASDVAVNVWASVDLANGHKITSEFPDIRVRSEGEWGAKTFTAEGKLNGGGATLKVHTSTGDISFKRASR